MDINKLCYVKPALEELLQAYNWKRCEHTGMLETLDYDEETLLDDVFNSIEICCTGAMRHRVSDMVTTWVLCDSLLTLEDHSGLLFIHYTTGEEVDRPA
ncbi:hypothetical protein [Vibrio phage vB_VpaS_AL-2]|nr:hypothetical protein [Vibrio phage vB_VpaS_AL-2]